MVRCIGMLTRTEYTAAEGGSSWARRHSGNASLPSAGAVEKVSRGHEARQDREKRMRGPGVGQMMLVSGG